MNSNKVINILMAAALLVIAVAVFFPIPYAYSIIGICGCGLFVGTLYQLV